MSLSLGQVDPEPAAEELDDNFSNASAKVFDTLDTHYGRATDGYVDLATLGAAEHWLLRPSDVLVDLSRALGSGAFGVVYPGTFYGKAVAVKVAAALPTGRYGRQRGTREIVNELRALRQVRHANIVLFYGAVIDVSGDGTLALVLEFVDGLPMGQYMSCGGGEEPFPAPCLGARYVILKQISEALWYLHERPNAIVHGDLKPQNVLLESSRAPLSIRAKLLDFGLSRVFSSTTSRLGGSLRWMAPELVDRSAQRQSTTGDVFSFGRLCHYVCTGLEPFGSFDDAVVKALNLRRFVAMPWPPWELAEHARSISEESMELNPAERPTMVRVHQDLLRWPLAALLGASELAANYSGALVPLSTMFGRPEEALPSETREQQLQGLVEPSVLEAYLRPQPLSTQPKATPIQVELTPESRGHKFLALDSESVISFTRTHSGELPRATLRLTSVHDAQVCFNFMSTGPAAFAVYPGFGTLRPQTSIEVCFLLRTPPHLDECINGHRFLLKARPVQRLNPRLERWPDFALGEVQVEQLHVQATLSESRTASTAAAAKSPAYILSL